MDQINRLGGFSDAQKNYDDATAKVKELETKLSRLKSEKSKC
jgi:hypothetical protein